MTRRETDDYQGHPPMMTLRDAFAIGALGDSIDQVIMRIKNGLDGDPLHESAIVARAAYVLADAMLAEREKLSRA